MWESRSERLALQAGKGTGTMNPAGKEEAKGLEREGGGGHTRGGVGM